MLSPFHNIGSFFISKNTILNENENLRLELENNKASLANYNSVLEENLSLKDILGRKEENKEMVLAAILMRPNQSLYDTLIIDAGSSEGVKNGSRVFAYGNVPIGRVADVYADTSKVVLYSTSGEKTGVTVTVNNVSMELVGRGGGNFEMILPRDFVLPAGTEAVLPGLTPYVVAKAQTTISDLRDSAQKVLFVSPINIQEIKFVEVEIKHD